ncbi:class I SAM-dependent methyltransferase [Streptomyces rimosus]|uniref:class I SAM-dependent methyltransferase n=1 Tax=Streptomyces rimosus TaxID=1927 RepID=UPI00373AE7D7
MTAPNGGLKAGTTPPGGGSGAEPTPPPPPAQPYYAQHATDLADRYESLVFETVHRDFLPLLPPPPARIADIGAGTGRDAAALAARGHTVLAVEPVPELRALARSLHPSPSIHWLSDALPGLPRLDGEAGRLDAILLSAVWMHLPEPSRPPAMRRLHDLLAPGGRLFLTLRPAQAVLRVHRLGHQGPGRLRPEPRLPTQPLHRERVRGSRACSPEPAHRVSYAASMLRWMRSVACSRSFARADPDLHATAYSEDPHAAYVPGEPVVQLHRVRAACSASACSSSVSTTPPEQTRHPYKGKRPHAAGTAAAAAHEH